MCPLYGFMRVCDDLGDDPAHSPAEKQRHLQQWRTALHNALNGDCSGHPVFPALVDVVRQYDMPTEYLQHVIDGVQADLTFNGFATFDELASYCYQVAGAVGLCCLHIWGFDDEQAIPRAIDCGTAFQLTNILRDLGEDAAMGRVYLPRDELGRFGVSADDITAHRRNEGFCELMQFQVQRAAEYYQRARDLFPLIHRSGKPILAAMLNIYGGLLQEIELRNYDVFARRVALSRWRKLRIVLNAILRYRVFRCQR